MEAPSPEVSGDFEEAFFVEQLGENEGPRNNLEIDLKEDLKVNFSNTFHSFSGLRHLFTALFWSGLWARFTVFLETSSLEEGEQEEGGS